MSTLRSVKCDGCGKVLRPGEPVFGAEVFRATAQEDDRGQVFVGREEARGELDLCGDCAAAPSSTFAALAERVLRPLRPLRKFTKSRLAADADCDGEDES